MKRKLVLNLALVLISTGLGLATVELLLRIVNPPMTYAYMPMEVHVSYFRPSTLLPSELRPNHRGRFKMLEFDTTVATNSFGLRDNEVDFSKPRILCMGDSFTFGFGVENDETFCAILERLFGGKYDFLNAGFADGYSPDTYALWLSKYGRALTPAGIIVCLFGNDYDEVSANTWLRGDRVMRIEDDGLPDRIVKTGYLITEDGVGIRDNIIAKLPVSIRRLLKQSYLVAFLRAHLIHDLSRASYRANSDRAYNDQKFIKSLELLRTVAGDRLTAFYLVTPSTPAHNDRGFELARQFAAKYNIPVLANEPDFSAEDYFPLDTHWKAAGHMKAARYLHHALTELGF